MPRPLRVPPRRARSRFTATVVAGALLAAAVAALGLGLGGQSRSAAAAAPRAGRSSLSGRSTGARRSAASQATSRAAAGVNEIVYPYQVRSQSVPPPPATSYGWTLDSGVDISPAGPISCANQPVLVAIGSGTVSDFFPSSWGFGPEAMILHLDAGPFAGRYVYYGHSLGSLVKVGDHVSAGQPITHVGCGIVGSSSAPHVEIGVSMVGKPMVAPLYTMPPQYPASGSTANEMNLHLIAAYNAPYPPEAPAVTVTGGNGTASLQWTVPANGGSPLTGYTISRYVNGTLAGTTSVGVGVTSQTFTGLTNGKAYRYEVTATNAYGDGPPGSSGAVVPPFAAAVDFVGRQSADVLGRFPTPAEMFYAVVALNGGADPGSYVANLRRSADATSVVDPVTRLYLAYFGRTPDPGGLSYWVQVLRQGGTLFAVSDQFALSPEFVSRYGSLTNAAFVNLVYQNVLGRACEPSGCTWWTGQLNGATMTRGQVMVGFSESNEYRTAKQPTVDVMVTWIDLFGVAPKPADLTLWVKNLTTGGRTITGLADSIFATPGYALRVA